uniref:BlaI/MecI/CopY family transcriptional regulator n=1 Tax=Roseihalotalea indica TaxID=2867963 RepID=A0AA49JIW6_9BACT|nr:BlaI/MecI/CopY family transcriptional regulator [Tunicatimonas sp. TK19036]
MEELTKTEERIMQVFWRLKKAFVKDVIEELPDDPKPPYNTISSVVRILEKKGYLGYTAYGKTYEYYPAISKAEYRKMYLKKLLSGYFDNSPVSLLSFMVKEEKLSEEEIEALKKIIDKSA